MAHAKDVLADQLSANANDLGSRGVGGKVSFHRSRMK